MRGTLARSFTAFALLATLVVAGAVGEVATAPPAGAASPTPTAARTGVPANIWALGDSITTATGTDNLGAEVKANSWVTGSNSTVNSMRARLGIATTNAGNLAANGKRMGDLENQATALPTNAQYVVIELGGNDLCRPSVGEMTSVADYRARFRAGLAAVAARAPNALIFVASIPDIYNLWYIRGAPSSVNPHVADQTGQAGQARLYWGTLGVIPCQSLLDDPEGTSAATVNRRLQVRQRNLDFNQVLREECGAVLRCRYDGDLLFNRSSNRTTPPNGPVAPRAQWWFEDDDISHNTGTFAWACPAPGVLSGGTICGDHFHPSLRGQGKLAAAGHEASFQFQTDTTAPTRTITLDRPADGDGVYAGPVGVTFGGDDGAGLRGQEVRVHQPNGSVGAWQQHLGVAPPLTVSATGTTYVEVRSLDVNGNLSASLLQPVTIAPDQFGDVVGTVSGPGGPVAGAEVRLHAAGAQGVVATDTTDGSGAYAFTDLLASGDVKIEVVDPSGVHQGAWAGGADHATATVVDVPGGGTVTVDVALALTPGTLAGTVTDAAGPVEGVEVTVHAAGAEGVVAQAVTGADGTYTVDLVPGDYRVRFVDPTGVHAGEWHADATNHATATTATVTRTTTTTVDAELAVIPGGVTGTVTGPDGPVVGVTVTVDGAAPTATDDAGAYTVTGLAPGDHTVSVAGVACATTGAQVGVAVPTGGGTAVADVTVTAVTPAANGFPDVADALDPAVDWLVDPCHQPLRLAGFGDGTFRPTAVLTRGQAVLSLWHIAGRPAVSTPHRLRGVPATLAPAVRWAVAARHLTGRADGTFGAGVAITRGDLARFVHRVAAPGPTTTPHGLTDVPRRLEQAVRWLVAEGVAAPTGTRFRPTAPARRGLYATWAFEIA